MKVLLFICLVLFTLSSHSDEKRIYQTDSIGNIQYIKPSYAIQNNGRIIETDAVGNKQYNKQQYQIKGDKTFQVDSQGSIEYHKPHFETK